MSPAPSFLPPSLPPSCPPSFPLPPPPPAGAAATHSPPRPSRPTQRRELPAAGGRNGGGAGRAPLTPSPSACVNPGVEGRRAERLPWRASVGVPAAASGATRYGSGFAEGCWRLRAVRALLGPSCVSGGGKQALSRRKQTQSLFSPRGSAHRCSPLSQQGDLKENAVT